MTVAVANEVTSSITYNGPSGASAPADQGGLSFGELLSDINPLQYLPVVGTIYRAVTGDTIAKPLREAGSVVVSGLMGGPVGLATSLATLAFEKLTGIDFETTGQSVLASLGIGSAPAGDAGTIPAAVATAAPSGDASPATTPPTAPAPDATASAAWSPAQLSAYGVTTQADGTLRSGGLTGADVLNDLQLRRTAGTLATA